MPAIESADSGTGRVTRSLRKRLTSVDSDASSRPGTPVISSLPTLQEAVTPSKRVTRRTSLSTPIATPSKAKGRFESTEVSSSPARRTGKRRSLSIQEHEEQAPKSKDLIFDTVKEEETNEKIPEDKNRRVTRSSPKCPLEEPSKLDTPKQGGVKKSSEEEQECMTVDDSRGNTSKSPVLMVPKKQTKVMLKKEKNIDEMIVKQVSPPKQSEPKSGERKNLSLQKNKAMNEQTTPLKAPLEEQSTHEGSNKKKFFSSVGSSPLKVQSEHNSPVEIIPKKDRWSDVKSSPARTPKLDTPTKDTSGKTATVTTLFSPKQVAQNSPRKDVSVSEENQNTSSSAKAHTEESSQKKKTRPEKLKTVAFDGTLDEDSIKSVFPKTPGLTKSKSYILDVSNECEKESSYQSTDTNKNSQTEEAKNSDKYELDEEDAEMLSAKTPYKLKLNAVESSTPIHSGSPKAKRDSSKVEEQKNVSTKESNAGDAMLFFPRTWSHSVSGTVDKISKIDSIESEEAHRKKLEEEEAKKSQSFTSQKSKKSVHDDSDNDSDLLEDDQESTGDEGEDRSREKTIFVDDEAMEAEDGEDSMDSEERDYLAQNELPVYGESIGSEDSGEDECEEEADEEDAAFVVSDTEEIVQEEFDSEEEVVEKREGKGKKYKRIMQASESSNEDETSSKGQEMCCLKLDSSVEEEQMNCSPQDEQAEDVEETANENNPKRKSLQDDGDDKVEPLPNKRKSLKNIEQQEEIADANANGEQLSPRKSIGKLADDNKGSETEDHGHESTQQDRKSLSHSKRDKSMQQTHIIDVEIEHQGSPDDSNDKKDPTPSKSRKSLKKNKADVSQSQDVDCEDGNLNDNFDEQEKQNLANSSKKKSRKSSQTDRELDRSQNVEPTKQEKNQRKKSLSSACEMIDSPKEAKNTSMKQTRKSLNKNNEPETASDNENLNNLSSTSGEKETSRKSLKADRRKSLNKSNAKAPSSDTENQDDLLSISAYNGTEEEEEGSRSSLNTSTKSLNKSRDKNRLSITRTLPEKANEEYDQEALLNRSIRSNKFGKSFTSAEESFDTEETLSAYEGRSVKSHMSSKKNRKSLSSNNSFFNDEELDADRSFAKDDSAVEETQFKKPQRRSISSRNVSLKDKSYSENSEKEADNQEKHNLNEEDEEDAKFSDTEMEEDQKLPVEKSRIMEFLGEEDNNQYLTSPAAADTKRKSVNKSHLDETFQLDPKSNATEENLHRSTVRKSLNQSQMQTETVKEENMEMQDKGNDSYSSGEILKNLIYMNNMIRAADSLSKDNSSSTTDEDLAEEIGMEYEDKTIYSNFSATPKKEDVPKNVSSGEHMIELDSDSSDEMDEHLKQIVNAIKEASAVPEDNAHDSDYSSVEFEDDRKVDKKKNSVESEDEVIEFAKKLSTDPGLSVSLGSIQLKKKKIPGVERGIHNSFTIGVSVRQTTPSSPSSSSDSSADNNHAKKISPENASNKSTASPLKGDGTYDQKRTKRTSVHIPQDAEDEKESEPKRKRKSSSFCGVVAPNDENEMQQVEPKSESKVKKQDLDLKTNIEHILSRCDEILEAANRAKREAKLNAKKTKVKKPKWMDREEKGSKEEDEVKIPLVSRKELKRKEKIKQELAKAIKHSTAMLKTVDSKLTKKLKVPRNTEINETHEQQPTSSSKRLPTEFLDVLENVPQPKRKKPKEIALTPPSDKENSKKSSNKRTYAAANSKAEKKKKKFDREILETATGTIIVEPVTPVKLRYQNGFRESPKTPMGFKVDDIHGKDKTKKRGKKLFTPSGEFIEEDLSISRGKLNSKKSHKRNREIEEPTYSLAKTQWTPSGIFIEEDLSNSRPLANSTTTQFMVSSINNSKRNKSSSKIVSASTLSSALSFKQNAVSKVQRESSRDVIHGKQRKFANHKF